MKDVRRYILLKELRVDVILTAKKGIYKDRA